MRVGGHALTLPAAYLGLPRLYTRRPPRATCHVAAIYGAAQVTPPALEGPPPPVFWSNEEIAIDAFHHAVYAAAMGLAYELIAGGDRARG